MRRTKVEAEQTRDAIIAAAIPVFLERGFSRATFEEIARTAGVTRGAVTGISVANWRYLTPWNDGPTCRTRHSATV